MKSTTFTRFRNHAKDYFDAVERGETVEIYRHGKPVALLTPVQATSPNRWKTAFPRKLKGVSLSRAILFNRADR
ncbi:MAG: type II toxin-antitoxin system prevent-host-death family antitoxin [Deltaproteobacteria bacterium]|nr:type II toxin-antitoxin system prevent-host-death family antitoxin [Deltaproteobacteria bacterium]